jgi:SAM-dependent methyltransferase
MAPEKSLQCALQSSANIEYVSADLNSPLASVHTDITAMSFNDNSFDVVVCNHVLEHIPDDRQAIRELARVLKPGGWAVLQVPIGAERTATEEDPWIANPDEQLRRFGQINHVRVYAGADYVHRLENGGFAVERYSLPKQNGEPYTQRFGLLQDEDIFIARKPMSPALVGHSDRSSQSL